MKLKYFLYLILIFSFASSSAIAQNTGFDFDYAGFRANDSTTHYEFYYQFDKSYFSRNSENKIKIALHLILKSQENKLIEKKFIITDKFDPTAISKASVGKFDLELSIGKYFLSLNVTDLNKNDNKFNLTDTLIAVGIKKNKPSLSDIELAYLIEKAKETNSPFYKNTYNVIPNPESVYSYLNPTVYFYYEIYGIENSKTDSLILITELISDDGKTKYRRETKLRNGKSSVAKVSQISMNRFYTSGYYIKISIVDIKSKYAYTTIKKFYYIGEKLNENKNNSPKTIADVKFGGLSETECDKIFREAQYIATKEEKERYDNLTTLREKQLFLSAFWKKRDTKPETDENEYFTEYNRRLNYVNKTFRIKTKEGFLTDRGRVYLLYGEPDEIDRYPFSLGYKPYEVWYYHSIEGGVVFVFADLTGYGDFTLLHSTKRGEIYNANWKERIRAH